MQEYNSSYKEIQKIPLLCGIGLLLLPLTVLLTVGIVKQIVYGIPFGKQHAPDWLLALIWVSVGLVIPAFFFSSRMEVEIQKEKMLIQIRYIPLKRRHIALSSIQKAEVWEFNPIRDYGGWGIRLGNSGWAYTARGNQGVMLTLEDGERLLIGSQNPELLFRELMKLKEQA